MAKIRELFFSLIMEFIMEGLNFSLNFCRVYYTSGALGHVYGGARQLEGILGTFEIGFFGKN